MTITSLILRFRCRPPIPTVFTPNCHCPFSLYLLVNTRYGSFLSRGKAWIKVCNISFLGRDGN
jgi:hypothetical protein